MEQQRRSQINQQQIQEQQRQVESERQISHDEDVRLTQIAEQERILKVQERQSLVTSPVQQQQGPVQQQDPVQQDPQLIQEQLRRVGELYRIQEQQAQLQRQQQQEEQIRRDLEMAQELERGEIQQLQQEQQRLQEQQRREEQLRQQREAERKKIEEERRLKGIEKEQRKRELIQNWVCPLTNQLMEYPVFFYEDTITYEKVAIAEFVLRFNISPMTLLPIENKWMWNLNGVQTNGDVNKQGMASTNFDVDVVAQMNITAHLQQFPNRKPKFWERIQSTSERPPFSRILSQEPSRQLKDYQHRVQPTVIHTLPDHIILQRGRPDNDRYSPISRLIGRFRQQQPECWIRKFRIVKERGRRPWSVIQQRQAGQDGQQERQYHRFDLYEAETCFDLAREITLGLQQTQGQGQNNYEWKKKYFVYHVWDGNMGRNFPKLPLSVITGLRQEITKRKNEAQHLIDQFQLGVIDPVVRARNDPNSRFSMRLIGCHTLIEAQEIFRTEFFDSMDQIFPVQIGPVSQEEVDDAFLRQEQRRTTAQTAGQQIAAAQDINGLDPKDLYDDKNDEHVYNHQFFIQNQSILPDLEFANSNGRGTFFAQLPGVQTAVTELAALISPKIPNFGDAAMKTGGFTGINWATQFGGYEVASKRLIRAASVLSRLKREIVSTRSAVGLRIQMLCNRFNAFFAHPGLPQMTPQNANNNVTIATFALARMAIAIDPQSSAVIDAIKHAKQLTAGAQLLSVQTTELFMRCINTTFEPLRPTNPQYVLIQEYLNRSLQINTHYKSIESIFFVHQPDFNARFKECESNPHRLLLWHGSGTGFWMSVISTGLYLPGVPSFTSYGGGFQIKHGTYGIFFADMAKKAFDYTDRDRQHSNVVYMGLFDVCLGQQHPYFNGHVPNIAAGQASLFIDGQQKPNQAQNLTVEKNLQVPIGQLEHNAGAHVDSVGRGKTCEYILSTPEQAKLMYLVRIRVR
ncbi:MAG: hypothetical protein EZS28_012459 [Streblomastix strix]|uniref:Poly [ADP-ribose] polymerase n=1 Tax=Streblomastix strix TaxID=222440 RepID=A0A5J4WBH9_9EUKA|nr:MAG: hypothetical protein EZS28_012459 [Streblomastix strix]